MLDPPFIPDVREMDTHPPPHARTHGSLRRSPSVCRKCHCQKEMSLSWQPVAVVEPMCDCSLISAQQLSLYEINWTSSCFLVMKVRSFERLCW